jgi:hypothetical protein
LAIVAIIISSAVRLCSLLALAVVADSED